MSAPEPGSARGQEEPLDEWQVIDQVLTYLSQLDAEPSSDEAKEVLPLLEALRRATEIVKGRPHMVAMAEHERRELSAKAQAIKQESRRKSQDLEHLRAKNEVLKQEAHRGRQALDDALRRQAQLQEQIELARQPEAVAARRTGASQQT
eukprot:TRINITY_DN93838_c0_g1_i1.p1 TRINITY_DN93838_c0_g1~~TRINITY_DN93838_c0_g1_i1.p1  ORF type:complete len:149 (-),score=44.81 TRINITY_DN93838_c0_g1_i1:76-522(-)